MNDKRNIYSSASSTSSHRSISATLAIPCYNAANRLPSLLNSLAHQTCSPDEILVIDDGSTDSTKKIAKSYDVRLVVHEKNRGLACARNSAIENANSDVIIYLDDDTEPEKTAFERMLVEYTDSGIAGVGGQELFSPSSNRVDLWRNLFWRQSHGDKRIASSWMLPGLCCSYRKDILKEIGGFNEEYRTNGEDVDIGLRLNKAGYTLAYIPQVGVFHQRTDSFQSLLSLVYRHSYWQSRALRKNGINPQFQIRASIKWLAVSTGSSLVTHNDMVSAVMSPIVCLSAITGRLMEVASRKN